MTPGETIVAVADRLGFTLDDDALEEITAGVPDVHTDVPTDRDLEFVNRSDDPYNALLAVHPEPRRRVDDGPLAGRRVAVKDNIAARDLLMTCGSAAYRLVPSTDATVVSRLLDAGGALVGKATMEPMAFGPTGEFSDFGHVENPVDPDRVPGGSSSGSGAAVAGGLVDLALGTDTGGSVRIPAACCGVVGVKPTHGLVPRDGLTDFAPSLDTIGPLAVDVDTAARALDAIAGPTTADPSVSSRPVDAATDAVDADGSFTVGLPASTFDSADAEVAAAVRAAVERAGFDVVAVDWAIETAPDIYFRTGATEFAWLLDGNGVVRGTGTGYSEELRAALRDAKRHGLGSHVAARVLPGAVLDELTGGAAYVQAQQERQAMTDDFDALFSDVDALVTPTIRGRPPKLGETTTSEDVALVAGNTLPVNLVGAPAATVPVATVDDLPVSAQAIAPRFEDARAVAVASVLESVSEHGG